MGIGRRRDRRQRFGADRLPRRGRQPEPCRHDIRPAAVNAVLSQFVSALNYLGDVNASGTLSVTDSLSVNANLTQWLPAP